MKIGFATEFNALGGGETNLAYLASELQHRWGVKVLVVCPPGQLANLCEDNGVEVTHLRLKLWKGWLWGLPLAWYDHRLVRLFDTCDIVHAYSLHALPKLFWVRAPLVWTNHGYWEKVKGLRAMLLQRHVAMTVAVSSETYYVAALPADKKCLIHLGVPSLSSHPRPKQPVALNRKVQIACVARFQQIKGQDLLIDAMRLLAAEMAGWQFVVHFVGSVNTGRRADNKFMAMVKRKAYEATGPCLEFRFHGFRQDVTRFYETVHLVVVPSRYESFSMVTVEALSTGTPVVVPDIGGPADIINSETIGTKFKPGDVHSLRAAIQRSLLNFASFSAKECYIRAQDFSVASQAAKHMAIYNRLIRR